MPFCLVLCIGLLAGLRLPIGGSVDVAQAKPKAETMPELVARRRLTANDRWTTFVLLGMLERGASAGACQDKQHLGQTIGARLQMKRIAGDCLGKVKDLPKMAHALIAVLDGKPRDQVAARDTARKAAGAKVQVLLGLR